MLQIAMHIITNLHGLCFQAFVKRKKRTLKKLILIKTQTALSLLFHLSNRKPRV